jgi:hypothetical protein
VSSTEYIFLNNGLNIEETARQLADALGFTVERDQDRVLLSRDDDGYRLVGELSTNYLAPEPEPEPPHTIDQYPLILNLHRKAPPDWQRQMRSARAVFNELITTLRWPALLTHDTQTAIADWSPIGGLRNFPEHTSVDDEQVEPHDR